MNARRWTVLFCALLAALMLVHPAAALSGAKEGLSLWLNSVLPALLPFFVLSSLLSRTGVLTRAGRRLAPLMRFAALPGEAGAAALLGAVSGYPVGARLSGELYAQNVLNLEQMEYLCGICNLASPSFLAGTVAASLLGAPGAGVLLILCHLLGAALTALLFSPLCRRAAKGHAEPWTAPQKANSGDFSPARLLIEAIADGMTAMLKVGGTLIFFSVVLCLLEASGLLALLTLPLRALGLKEDLAAAVVSGFFEKSRGCAQVAALSLPLSLRAALCSALCAFGGCGILLQTIAFAPVRPLLYWRMKAVQGVLCGLLCYGALMFFPGAATVFASEISLPLPAPSVSFLLLLSLGLCAAAGIFLWLIGRHRHS